MRENLSEISGAPRPLYERTHEAMENRGPDARRRKLGKCRNWRDRSQGNCPGATLKASMRPPVLSVVVPAFNEAARIFRTINDIREEMERLGTDAELLVVDDGSVDETPAI